MPLSKPISVFLAGIMQGSKTHKELHAQDYRPRLKQLIEQTVPGSEVYCPLENNRNSVDYAPKKGKQVFLGHIEQAGAADVLVSYLPEASMGTAVEMWRAWEQGRLLLTISPMKRNWVVKFLSARVFEDFAEFDAFARSGELERLIDAHAAQTNAATTG